MSRSTLKHRVTLPASTAMALCLGLMSADLGANSLLDVYLLALDNDAQFKAAQAALRAEGEQLGVARAALLPQVNAQGQYLEEDGETEQSGGIRALVQSNDDEPQDTEKELESYTLSLSQNIFSASDWFEYRSARNIRRRTESQLRYEHQSLIVRVIGAYFAVLRAAEELNFGQAEENAVFRQMQRTQNRFNTGLATATDALEAQSAYDLIKAERLLLEERLSSAREALGVITGINHEELWPLRERFPITPPEARTMESWIARAIEGNHRLHAVTFALAAAHDTLKARRSAHLPTLSGNLARSWNEDDSLGIFGDAITEIDNQSWGVKLEIPLFTGGRLSALRRSSYQSYLQARENLNQTRRQITQRVRTLHKTQRIGAIRVQAHRQAVRSAERALLSIRNGYETGIRDLVNVLDAEKNLYQARSNLHNVRIGYLLDNVELRQISGTLAEEDVRLINSWLKAPAGAQQLPQSAPRRDKSSQVKPNSKRSRIGVRDLRGQVDAAKLLTYAPATYTLQLGAWRNFARVTAAAHELEDFIPVFYIRGADGWWRLGSGTFDSRADALAARGMLPAAYRKSSLVRPLHLLAD